MAKLSLSLGVVNPFETGVPWTGTCRMVKGNRSRTTPMIGTHEQGPLNWAEVNGRNKVRVANHLGHAGKILKLFSGIGRGVPNSCTEFTPGYGEKTRDRSMFHGV